MAQILLAHGEILLNRGQVQALIDHANQVYQEDWNRSMECYRQQIPDPEPFRFSGHAISGRMPLTLEKLIDWYDNDYWKLYLDRWMGESLPQVCFIPKPWTMPDGETYYPICMDDGWVDYIQSRTISTLSQVFDKLA